MDRSFFGERSGQPIKYFLSDFGCRNENYIFLISWKSRIFLVVGHVLGRQVVNCGSLIVTVDTLLIMDHFRSLFLHQK